MFPLVRHLSSQLTRLLLPLPGTPNQVTWAAITLGLGSAGLLVPGDPRLDVAAALLLVCAYVLDNCDGEIARARCQTSHHGQVLDTAGDVVVHAAFFAALGLGVAARRGEAIWAWLGGAAFAGACVNSALSLRRDAAGDAGGGPPPIARPLPGSSAGEWLVFVFRELFRADFCFIVLALALTDGLWLLLPAGAIGAQVYWLSRFARGADRYHV